MVFTFGSCNSTVAVWPQLCRPFKALVNCGAIRPQSVKGLSHVCRHYAAGKASLPIWSTAPFTDPLVIKINRFQGIEDTGNCF